MSIEKPKRLLDSDFLDAIPHHPGVYRMLDDKGNVLYVGKALDLRKRLASYARHLGESGTKTGVLLDRTERIDTILTRTEKEALILEASLIKQQKPRYNIILRDDKNYPYIKVTVDEEWPRVIMTRKRLKDKARYFGPYSSASSMWVVIRYLKKHLPLRQCKNRKLKSRKRPCLNYQMKQCLAPCTDTDVRAQYLETVQDILHILEGRARQTLGNLKKKMDRAASELRYEDAARHRDQMQALEQTLERQVMVTSHFKNQDIVGFARKDATVAVSFLFVREGAVTGNRTFYLPETIGNDTEILSEAIERFYGDEERDLPNEVFLPFVLEKQELLAAWFSALNDANVGFRVPKRGDGVKLVELACDNARQVFHERDARQGAWNTLSAALMRDLALSRPPERIECLDISNIGGKEPVGSLVSFYQGEKETANYRHYRIKGVEGADDYAMMAEVLKSRLAKDRESMPDLLLLDGGKGHLNMALAVAAECGLVGVDIASIAKEKDREGEKIYRPYRKNPILLPRNSPSLLLLMKIRDEAHRFGITFHRKLRGKAVIKSVLDEIHGVGPARKKALLLKFGSIEKLRTASIEELCNLPGISRNLAEQIEKFLQGDG